MTEKELLERFRVTPEGQRLLRVIRYAEGTEGRGRDPYRVMFGGGTFGDLSRHPDRVISSPGGYSSAAAGAYQFLPGSFASHAKALNLPDFGPRSQDLAALRAARNRLMPIGGLSALQKQGFSPEVANALAPEWASIPTASGRSYYGQPSKPLGALQRVYGQAPVSAAAAPEVATTQPQRQAVSIPRKDFRSVMQSVLKNFGVAIPGFSSSAPPDKSSDYLSMALQLQDSDAPGAEDLAQEYLSKAVLSSAESPDPIETVLETARGIQEVQEFNRSAAELEKTLNPDVPATAVAPTTPTGSPFFVARTGSTGISTGPHLDIRWADRRPITPKDVDKYLQIGGKLPSQLTMTSGYGPRRAPAPGASTYHPGVDLSVPVGTPIYSTGGAKIRRSLGKLPGAGYTVELNTPEGLLQLLHLQEKSSPLS